MVGVTQSRIAPKPAGRRSFLGAAAAASVACLWGGCGVSTVPLRVQVRDVESKAPIVGAYIVADSLALGTSLQFGDIVDDLMGRRAAATSRGETDANGVATVTIVPGRSVRFGLLGTELSPEFLLVNPDLAEHATDWMAFPASPGAARASVEMRAGPPDKVTSR